MTNSAASGSLTRLALGPVELKVRDMEQSLAFYENLLGFRAVPWEDGSFDGDSSPYPTGGTSAGPGGSPGVGSQGHAGRQLLPGTRTVALAAGGNGPSRPLLVLHAHGEHKLRGPGAAGLYHVALLYPSREHLARAAWQLLEGGYRLQGASDHVVSEALYLADPDGNGIELYSDRPPDYWAAMGGAGQAMTTKPLDFHGLLASVRDPETFQPGAENPPEPMPEGATVGHIHLAVSNLEEARRFYSRGLGIPITNEDYPGALFLAAGGYHHHIGLNTWSTLGGPPAQPDSTGLAAFTVTVPEGEASMARARLAEMGFAPEGSGESAAAPFTVVDKDGIVINVQPPWAEPQGK